MRVHQRSALLAVVVLVTAAGCAAPLSQRERTTVGGAGTGAIIGSATGHAGTGAAIGGGVGTLGGALLGNELETRERREIEADREIRAHEREIRRQRAEIAEIRRREGYDYDDGCYGRYDHRDDYDDRY